MKLVLFSIEGASSQYLEKFQNKINDVFPEIKSVTINHKLDVKVIDLEYLEELIKQLKEKS